MPEYIDIKFIIGVGAMLLTIFAYIPYFKDIFAKKTKPHLYTWLIWLITQGTATVALLYGGGKFGSLSLIAGTLLVLSILLLSFKYGTTDISRSDKFILTLALFAVLIWWQLDNPLFAILMVSAIDGAGFIPTIRKTFTNPESETLSFWVLMSIVVVLAVISNAEYNILTVAYLSTLFVGNVIVVLVIYFRKKSVKISIEK